MDPDGEQPGRARGGMDSMQLDWSIEVAGSQPYAFTPSWPGVTLSLQSVTATATELLTSDVFRIVAQDDALLACSLCEQRIEWTDASLSRLLYQTSTATTQTAIRARSSPRRSRARATRARRR